MALNNTEQIKRLLKDAKNILITFKKTYDGDALGSALALKLFTEKLGKRADIVCDDFVLHPRLSFLKRSNKIQSQLGDLHQCIITVDIAQSGLSELSYDKKDDKLRIFITPQTGYITRDNITTAQTEYKYDVIIVLDTPDVVSLGNIYTNNGDFFHTTPIINIDHKSSNEYFGSINMVDIPASTTSEIMYSVLTQIGEEAPITRHMANALLTGLIEGTRSFKHRKVRPNTLDVASKLVELGADRAFIMKNLYQTKSISTFRLWGTALANMVYDKKHNIVSTTITRDDFIRSQATKNDLDTIIDELITTSPDAQFILVLNEHPDEQHHIEGTLRIIPSHHATDIMKKYHAQGDEDHTTFSIKGKNLKKVEEELVKHIKEEIS